MIDIHNHGLYQVDDGAASMKESVDMLKQAQEQGIKLIIYTPHYRRGMFKYPVEEIQEHYEMLKPYAEKYGIRIALGCEYHVNGSILEYLREGRVTSLAGGDYVLTEYAYESSYDEIYQTTQKLVLAGYYPVIAHVERYQCFQKAPEIAEELQEQGAMIQVNADSVLGLEGFKTKGLCRKMLKNHWVDIIASDAHGTKMRANHMGDCRKKVEQKYGKEYARELFYSNPRKLFRS